MRQFLFFLLISCGIFFSSCSSYRQNVLFQTDEFTEISNELNTTSKNKEIAIGDYLEFEVFTKYGEKIVDPDFELAATNPNSEELKPKLKYLVRNDGNVKLPMIGDVFLRDMTLNEAEDFLETKFEKFYNDSFVKLNFINKRVIILGSPGGQVIPLENENMELVEVIALAQGIDNLGKGHNIRVLRDDQVFLADLTTIDGFKKGNVTIEAGDIIYIEPVRRPFSEFLGDNAQIFTILISILTLSIVLSN